jgi:hypothetical protein
MTFAQTIDGEAISNEFALQPGQSVTYLADTTDLADATVTLEVSENGTVWTRARDQVGTLVPVLTGAGEADSETAILRNEKTFALRYRAVVEEVFEGTLAGEVAVTFADLPDPATLDKVTTVTDEGVEFAVPVTGTFILPIYADNTAALAANAQLGSLYRDGTTAEPLVVIEAE